MPPLKSKTGKINNVLKKPKIKFRQSLFWDVDPKTIDPDKNARYVIERILDFGTDDEVRWLVRYYPRRQIKPIVKTSRALQQKSKSLWSLIYQ